MNIIFSSSQQPASLDDNDLLKSATNLIFSLGTEEYTQLQPASPSLLTLNLNS